MLDETTYIERKKEGGEQLDFESLKNQGIRLLQELSGKIWTDYNIHDPGVTILEQLSFALTELNYLSGFDVKDILTSEDDEIKYDDLALYKPLEIFPSEAITHSDYCKVICDNVKGVRNVWVLEDQNEHSKGLYKFLIDVEKKYLGAETKIIENVKRYFNTVRNLCEDIEKIEVFKREPIEIYAIIDVNNAQEPDYILANILFSCFKVISPRVVFHSYKELIGAELSLEQILTGPYIKNGYIKEEAPLPPQQSICISELMKEVFMVEGVESITDFYILKEGKNYRTEFSFSDPLKGAYLKLPESIKELTIRLERNNRACTINIPEVLRKFNELSHNYKSTHNTSQDIEELYSLPKGKQIQYGEFFSIQNHFPSVYGINKFGVPPDALTERASKARQLKGYLLLFEQIMVNFLSQIKNIPALFSIDPNLEATYFTDVHRNVPNIEGLISDDWLEKPDYHNQQLKSLLGKYDDFYERRNRILDYILAMYGESFSQKTYQQFKYYYSEEELPGIICKNKILMLKYLVDMNRYKASSFNYQASSSNTSNIPSVKHKVSLLLGIRNFSQASYSDILANYNFRLISESTSLNYTDFLYKRKHPNVELDEDDIHNFFVSPTETVLPGDGQTEEIADVAKKVDYLTDGILSDEFFRYGINLNYYKIGKLNGRFDYTVVFKHPKYDGHIYIGDFKKFSNAVYSVNCLRQFLIKLNQDSEGMHIVEHILLRQEKCEDITGCHITNTKDEILFKSTNSYIKSGIELFISELTDILHNRNYYAIEEVEEGKYKLFLSQRGAKIVTGTELFESAGEAERAINDYCMYFKTLIESEGLGKIVKPYKYLKIPEEFFPHRISVVLPAWSARFNNERFRDYVEETFRFNFPAHIHPEFYWLDILRLSRFEKMYKNWLDSKTSEDHQRTNEYACELIKFLLENQQI